ncbi:MAG TPA: hypothetical protein VLY20_03795 [Nitrospiria bacterium]|nr:hypothetical protein [Nitrospiria bacterium]
MKEPLILDFDRSVLSLAGVSTVPLNDWQRVIRYGCSLADIERLETVLNAQMDEGPRLAFLGSGDFHHVSYLMIRRLHSMGPFQVVVFDNHPDNMRFPWGIHCGSWVHHVCRLPFVSRVTVVGITSDDIRGFHLFENHLRPLYAGKLFYFCFSPVPMLARRLGLSGIKDFRDGQNRLSERIRTDILNVDCDPVYLSIDKDVLSPRIVRTNWDQGILTEENLFEAVRFLKPRLLAADVTGEISFYRYPQPWKRVLSRLDGQSPPSPADLDQHQHRHRTLNEKLISILRPD